MRPTILVTGHTYPELVAARGGYDAWIARAAGLPLDRFQIIDGTLEDAALPPPEAVDGLIITGSPARVHEREPWSERCGAWSRQVLEAGAPVLGICYGHQLLGDAFGGAVGPNPRGREIGLFEVEVAEDPLFEGLPRRFPTLLSHLDAVNVAPRGARILGHSPLTPVQALAFGENGRTIQFHPEFDADIVAHLIEARRALIEAESGPGAVEALLARLRPVDTGPIILRNFLRHWLHFPV